MADDIINYFSQVPIHLQVHGREFDDAYIPKLGTATGFIFSSEQAKFLITNRHVVTGRHEETEKNLNKEGAHPGKITLIETGTMISLYKDSEYKNAIWYEHPTCEKVDVVAIPLSDSNEINQLKCINDHSLITDIKIDVGMEVFVIGYPLAIDVKGTPLWKRASIASEPSIDVDDVPKILIDTATSHIQAGSATRSKFSLKT